MMQFSTKVSVPPPARALSVNSHVAFFGSCFAEHVGARMKMSGLPALVNPFGVLYNPLSILQALTQNPTSDTLYFCDDAGTWHCWLTDSSFNASSIEACKAGILTARGRVFEWRPDTVIITLGTNRYYERLEPAPLAVGNCHKQPSATFREVTLTLEETITILNSICMLFPSAQVVFTVSPFRYSKYGFHDSQLAKSTLLLAIDAVQKARSEQVCYFPAYELVLDELRDYRFYAEDMLHPSSQAIDYVWERFVQSYMDDECHRYFVDFEPIRKALSHRPNDQTSPQTSEFLKQTHQRFAELISKYNIEP
ncbi:MAG: GSCFA domain-containing protein [Bacteroidaceae bacterium]|nr:GSCFA domain-containing protein [Bacteroidaceae bacterium]